MPCKNHPRVDDGLVRCSSCAETFCGDCIVGIGGAAFCGPCKTEWLLDRLSGLPDSGLDFASVWRRFLALTIDNLLFGLPYGLFLIVTMLTGVRRSSAAAPSFLSPFGLQLLPFLMIPLLIVYNGWMLAGRGQTLGKMVLGLRVVNADGEPLRTGQAWGRAALQQVFVSCFSIVNYLPAFFTPERTCIHDMAAKTRVVNWRP
ncbi:MAG: hypothetical protein QOJ16_1985 [Acidobacteriota bacterium]|nr:hypothetical protein [Acidobacteriota bacterium]